MEFDLTPENDTDDESPSKRTLRRQSSSTSKQPPCPKEERNATIKKVSTVLLKSEEERTPSDVELLNEYGDIVEEVRSRWRKRDEVKRRQEEFEEPEEELRQKCVVLAQAIAQSRHLVVYTGAGISTAARIPDYRGTNGIWTRLQQGKDIGNHDLSLAEPTYTHMALAELYKRNILKYVVSQNCDGLHLRSGMPRTALSEVHGDMYVEVCKTCKPNREYWRTFDVTENTARYSHKTMRKCYACNGPLVDTIVHFGERGSLQWPLNWSGASKNARKATTIVCLGSSLKVLKKYPWLWQMHKPVKRRPNLYIVNLQWTPKDDCANVKINGKCDFVMKVVMELLDVKVPAYDRRCDPIFAHGTPLSEHELHTTTQPLLKAEPATNCDTTTSNPPPQQSTPFSIDSILHGTNDKALNLVKRENTLLSPNCHALLSYFQLSSTILSGYHYPFQTSFLYSGLHSIINPLPLIGDEHSYSAMVVKKEEPDEYKCAYCRDNYKSTSCLFYDKFEPTFVKQQYRYSKLESVDKPLYCVCCDYTTEEEDEDEDATPDKISRTESPKVQPGWFGKGYRQRTKKYKKKPATN